MSLPNFQQILDIVFQIKLYVYLCHDININISESARIVSLKRIKKVKKNLNTKRAKKSGLFSLGLSKYFSCFRPLKCPASCPKSVQLASLVVSVEISELLGIKNDTVQIIYLQKLSSISLTKNRMQIILHRLSEIETSSKTTPRSVQ